MRGSLIGIFITLILVLSIPMLFLLSQETNLLSKKVAEPTPTPNVLSFISGQSMISGYVYHDTNKDGQRESEEKPFADTKVQMKLLKEGKATEETLIKETTTDSYGYFTFRFPVDSVSSYLVKVILPKGYKTVDSNPIILSDIKANMQKLVEFGLTPNGELPNPTITKKPTPKSASPTEPVTPSPQP